MIVELSLLGGSGLLEVLFPLGLEVCEEFNLNAVLGLDDLGSNHGFGEVGAIIHTCHTDFDLLLRINHL